jgi:hypothetical protein
VRRYVLEREFEELRRFCARPPPTVRKGAETLRSGRLAAA